jgi:hypothetical protein
MMSKESLRSIVLHREAEIARLRTALQEAKRNMENDEEAAAYLIIKSALNRPRETGRKDRVPVARS